MSAPRRRGTRGSRLNDVEGHGYLGRVVRKPVNANPGLKVNPSINFSCIKMFFTSFLLCSLTLHKLKTEGQTRLNETLIEKNAKLKSNFSLILG